MTRRKAPLLTRLEWKLSRFAIENLMLYVVIGMALVYVADLAMSTVTEIPLTYYLYFDRDLIFRGQVWRIVTFLFVPSSGNLIWAALELYFYYLLGSNLERQWGAFRFNLFYLVGILGTVVAGLVTGFATNSYLNLSLFFAFAILFPDFEFLVMFIIPVKVKWLAILDAVLYTLALISGDWSIRASILFSLANLLLFFWNDLKWYWNRLRNDARVRKMRQESRDRYRK